VYQDPHFFILALYRLPACIASQISGKTLGFLSSLRGAAQTRARAPYYEGHLACWVAGISKSHRKYKRRGELNHSSAPTICLPIRNLLHCTRPQTVAYKQTFFRGLSCPSLLQLLPLLHKVLQVLLSQQTTKTTVDSCVWFPARTC